MIVKTREDVLEMKDRISQIPNYVQMIALIFGIFGASFALIKLTQF